ncbi:MAG: SulP family inorganic anion transporter [Methylococcaceae bacterium]|nr:SulP family inorganic anion transporter [Methylococcaceae bacterium]
MARKQLAYYLQNLGHDIPAGIVVFLVALPLCLGVALASGAPLLSGLVAGIVGGLVVSWLSGSQLSVSGPAAGLTVIVLHGIEQVGGFEAFLVAVVLAGVLQLMLGFLRAGVISAYFPSAVIRGMLTAIGLILIMKQLPHAVGYGVDLIVDETYAPETPSGAFFEIGDALEAISPGAAIVTTVAIFIMLIWEKPIFKTNRVLGQIPGPLIAVLWGVMFSMFSEGTPLEIAGQHLVSLPEHGNIGHLIGNLVAPDFTQLGNWQIYILAATIAIIASLETLLSLEAIDKLDPYRRVAPTNQELKAQGVGNILSGLLGGLPITSVIVRSSANVNAGGRTKVASFVHGLMLLLSILFLVEWLNYIPLSALAAILLITGYKLAKPAIFLDMYRRGRDQFLPFAITVIAILATDLLKGIAIGIVIGLFFVMKANFHAAIALTRDGNHYLLRFRKDVSFLNKPLLRELLDQVEPDGHVIIDGTRADFIDQDILGSVRDYLIAAEESRITVHLRNVAGASGTGRELLESGALGVAATSH